MTIIIMKTIKLMLSKTNQMKEKIKLLIYNEVTILVHNIR